MKRTVSGILCLLLAALQCCVLLASCSNPPETESQSTAATQSQSDAEGQSDASAQSDGQQGSDLAVTIDNVRDIVVGVDEPIELRDGTKRALINFDNAATTPAFQPVVDAVNEELKLYGSIGRGFSQKSNHSTDLYNSTRDKVLNFVGADPDAYTCFYVNNTTDGLNKLASALIESEDDTVLVTRIEHHANDLSWRERCNVIWAEVDELGRVNYDDMERLLTENEGKVKYVSVTAASNVTGYVTDVHRVAKMAHAHGAFCAHPYVWRLMGISEDRLGEFEECTDVNTPGMIRISFGIYNTEEEVDKFLEMLPSLIELAKQEVDTQYSRAEPAF